MALDQARTRWTVVIATIATIALLVLMDCHTTPLKSDSNPDGGMGLQFAGDSKTATAIIKTWMDNGQHEHSVRHVWIDFPLIAAYVAMLVSVAHLLRLTLPARESRLWTMSAFVAIAAAVAAGACDAAENIGMLNMIGAFAERPGPLDAGTPCFVTVAAKTKFALLATSASLSLALGLRRVIAPA